MTWKHVSVIIACLAAVISCGLHTACIAVLPNIVTLVTFVIGGVIGIIQGQEKAPRIHTVVKAKDAPDVTNH